MKRMWRWLHGELSRLAGFAAAADRNERYEDEARFHLDMLIERNLARGLTPAEARRRALVEFGGVERFGEAARDEYRSRPLEEFGRDVRLAVRKLARTPAFTLAAALTLALGIGATTVMFSIVDHVVLRPLPYRDADRLVVVREVLDEIRHELPSLAVRAPHYVAYRERCEVCEDVAALLPTRVTWRGAGEARRLPAVRVSANLFPILGVQPVHGRLFLEEEDTPERSDVVVISHGFWVRHFGADPGTVGRTLRLGDTERAIVGVLPAWFRLPKGDELGAGVGLHADPDVYVPLALTQAELTLGGNWNYTSIARLARGVSREQAEAHFNALQTSLAAALPRPIELSALVLPLRDLVVGGAGRGLLLLLAAVGAVLLIVCVNLGNLLLARNAGRARESAVRAALGAGRARLVREALAENLVLAGVAGALGVALSWWGLQLLLQLAPADLPRLHEVRLDLRVAGVTLLLALLTGLGFGVLPALRAAGADPGEALKAGGRATGDRRGGARARGLLIATQVAMTAVLLVAAGLFLTSFVRVLGIDRGFAADRVLAFDVLIPAAEFSDMAGLNAIYDRLLHELRETPGIEAAAATSRLPLEGVMWTDAISEEGIPRAAEESIVANFHMVTTDYFHTMRIPLYGGRAFGAAEHGALVVVLSQQVAASLWPDEPASAAVGRRVQLGGHFAAEVIGVAADVTTAGLEGEREPIVYLPAWSPLGFPNAASIAVRSSADPLLAMAPARAALRRAAPGAVISTERTMQQLVADAAAARRFQMTLLVLFAATALLTACVGIYGVIAHSLSRRRGEIGVRMALGARRATIHRLIVGESLRGTLAGLCAGVLVVFAAGRFVASLLHDVRPFEPFVIGAVAALLTVVAVLAAYLPARRATAADPSSVLRE